MSTRRLRARLPLLRLCAVVAALTVSAAACVPTEHGAVEEFDLDEDATSLTAPEFPDGAVPDDLVVAGLVYELSSRPADLAFWAPSPKEARCVADEILDTVGSDRLTSLGFRPGTDGGSLADLAFDDTERSTIGTAFAGCVDLAEAVATLFFGGGRMSASAARCVATTLDQSGQLANFASGWVIGEPTDPFAGDTPLSRSLVDAATICIAEDAFDWPDLVLPGGPDILDLTRSAGQSGSATAGAGQQPPTTQASAQPDD